MHKEVKITFIVRGCDLSAAAAEHLPLLFPSFHVDCCLSLLSKYGRANQFGNRSHQTGYNHCDSDLTLDTTLTPSYSDATDSQLRYCDTELTPGETHISMLDCLLSCYNCCDPCVAANYNNLYNLPVMALSTH